MSDVRTILERGVGGAAPPPDGFERMLRRRDRKRRNERIAAGVVGLAIAISIAVVGSAILRSAPAPADRTQHPILHEGEVLEIAEDGVTLVATDTTTREQRPLARCTDCFYVRKFAPSAGGRWIAYEAVTCGGQCKPVEPGAGIWVVGATGPPIHVTPGASWNWAWSPTTEQLAFVVGVMHGTELVILDPATGEETSIASTGGSIYALAWSPDGTTIAYAANSFSGVFTVRPGEDARPIGGPSPGGACCDAFKGGEYLSWSPDGSSVAVSSHTSGVTVVRIDGSAKQTVLEQQPQHFAWSPDSRWIAYLHGHKVGVVPATGGEPVLLAYAGGSPGIWSQVAWSPDGRLIAFTQGGGRPWYAVASDGSDTPPPFDHIDPLEVERWIQG
jgi:hypothetical protein